MVARPCLNIVWSSASKTLIFLAVSSGALSIPYHYPSARPQLGSIAPLLPIGHLRTLIHPSAWKVNSRNFPCGVSQKLCHLCSFCYNNRNHSGGKRARERRSSMSAEENKALARRSWEALDNPDLIDEVYASDVVWHEPDRDIHGTEEAKQFISLYKSAFPDMNITVEDVLAEGDKVVTRVSIRGTHQGETEEFGPPTGRQIEGTLITISRIEGGKIVEDWDAYDNLTTLQQLGLAPEQ